MYSNFFSTPIHAMSVLGGDLAAPEQRGIVSAAMGVATSVGVASGDSRRWTLGWHPGGKGENPGNPGEDAFLLTNFCLMFMESSKIFQYICRKNVLNMSLEVNGRCPRFFPEWGNVGDKRPGSLVVSNDSLQHHFDLKRSWIIELESTNWQYLVNLIYATSSMFHMYIYIYLCFWHISNGDIASQNKTPCKLIESEKQKHDFNMTKSSLDWKCLKLQCEDNCWQVS